MVVDEVIGYAQAPCVIWVSTHTTMPAPSAVVGIPGYSGFPRSSRGSCAVSTGTPLMTVLIVRPSRRWTGSVERSRAQAPRDRARPRPVYIDSTVADSALGNARVLFVPKDETFREGNLTSIYRMDRMGHSRRARANPGQIGRVSCR